MMTLNINSLPDKHRRIWGGFLVFVPFFYFAFSWDDLAQGYLSAPTSREPSRLMSLNFVWLFTSLGYGLYMLAQSHIKFVSNQLKRINPYLFTRCCLAITLLAAIYYLIRFESLIDIPVGAACLFALIRLNWLVGKVQTFGKTSEPYQKLKRILLVQKNHK